MESVLIVFPHICNTQELLKTLAHYMEQNKVPSLFLFHIPKQVLEKSWTAHNHFIAEIRPSISMHIQWLRQLNAHLSMKIWLQSHPGAWRTCGGESKRRTRFSLTILVFLCQCHSTDTPFPFSHLSLMQHNVSNQQCY